jgi:Tol biopolymer transport system component
MTADLQELFDQAGRNPPPGVLDADAVLRRVRRARHRRITGAVVGAVAVTLALVVGLASQRLLSAEPVPVAPHPPAPGLGTLGRLAYGIDGDIYVADWDGRNPVRIADGAPSEAGDCGGYWGEGPIWSPDGRYLAYRGDGGEARRPCDRTVNVSDSAGHRVASFPGDGWAIAWSPDSTRIAAWVDFYEAPKLEIYGLDGVRQALLSMPHVWSALGDYDPVWAPDGASLVVPGGRVDALGWGFGHGVDVPVDGSTPRLLAVDDPRSLLMVAHSPDGAEIAYISSDGLGVAAADGSHARVLIPGALGKDFPLGPVRPGWSPTGDRIAFVRASGASTGRGRATELAVLDVASGSVVSLAGLSGAYTFRSIEFSPEGDRVLFARRDAAGASSLWSVDADGSDLHRLVAGTDWGDWQTLIPTR